MCEKYTFLLLMSINKVCYFARYIFDIFNTTASVEKKICLMTDYFVIVDIDECITASHKCDPNANCTNTVGSHSCSCEDGFTGSGSSCSGRSVTKLVSLQGTNGQDSIRVCEK